jgi:glycosyltransferase involved in cell wall biosynthesis
MITTDAYGRFVGEKTYAGAAARKMASVASAMRSVGHRAIIVSLPFVGTTARRAFYSSVVTLEGRTPAVFLATLRSKYLRKIFGPLFLAVFACRHVGIGDTVVLYNHAVEYIPALMVLRLRRVNVVQDIEDAPTNHEKGVRGWANRVSFAATFKLTNSKKMVVADHVARELNLDDCVVIHGVASDDVGTSYRSDTVKWDELHAGGTLKVHFGGTLIPETGVDLFCEAVELLAQDENRLDRHVAFMVTGIGELNKVRDLQSRIRASRKVNVEFLPELSKPDYIALIAMCHGSLSLKRPGSLIASTTFPSKVIEITAAGLALVCTRLGDVTSLFSDESAYFLPRYEPADLAEVILDMARDPDRVEKTARTGLDLCKHTFSMKTVGEAMTKLV